MFTMLTVESFPLYCVFLGVEIFFSICNFPVETAFSILHPATTTSEKLDDACPTRCEKNGSSKVLMKVNVRSFSGIRVVILVASALHRWA